MTDEPRTELERRALAAWTPDEPPPGFAERVVAAAARERVAADADPLAPPRVGLRWPRVAAAVVAAAALAGGVSAAVKYWPGAPIDRPSVTGALEHTRETVDLSRPSAVPQAAELAVPGDMSEKIDRHLAGFGARYGDAFKFHGSVVVARAGEVLYQGHFGLADVEGQVPVGETTRFKIGSLTQQFTAVAILQLRDEGLLGLDDPVQRHLPDFRHRGVTLRHLLSHTSGVPSYTDDFAGLEPGVVTAPAHVRAQFEAKPLEFPPGTDFDPSNSGYFLLGAVIERVSKRPLAEYMRTRVLRPAGMVHSSLGGEREAVAGAPLAVGYQFSEDEVLVPAVGYDLSVYGAAAGMISTPADLVRWDHALRSPGVLLPQRSIDEMYTPVREGYGLGWQVGHERGQTLVSHPGGLEGFNAAVLRYLGDELTVFALANTEAIDCRDVAAAVAAIAFGETPPEHVEHEESPVPPAMFGRYLGDYTLTAESRKKLGRLFDAGALELMRGVRVYDDGGRMFMLIPLHGAKWLHGMGEDRFFFKDMVGTTAEFGPPGAPVQSLTLRQRGIEFVLKKAGPGDHGGDGFVVRPGAAR